MLLTVFVAERPGVKLEVEHAGVTPAADILAIMSSLLLTARDLNQVLAARRREEYELIPVGRYGIHALLVRKTLLAHYCQDDLLALLRPLATNALLPGPIASIRIAEPLPPEGESTGLTVGSIMRRDLICASPEESVAEAAKKMNERRIGCLPVLEGETLVGLVTSRDIRRAAAGQQVRDVMSKDLVTVSEEAFLWEAQRLMERAGVERLPVVRGKKLLGLITKADLLKRLGSETDPLTGLKTSVYARWYAQSLLAAGKEIAVVFFDLNDFGQVNKVYGHGFGDRVLEGLAAILKSRTDPESDLPARYGGDEFVIVTTRPMPAARQLAADILADIGGLRFPEGVAVSACAGLAGGRRQAPRPGTHPAATVDDIINLASLASTKAKKQRVPLVVAGGKGEGAPAGAAGHPEGE